MENRDFCEIRDCFRFGNGYCSLLAWYRIVRLSIKRKVISTQVIFIIIECTSMNKHGQK